MQRRLLHNPEVKRRQPDLGFNLKTPVIFCGVNFEATKYGYPSSNITGVLEKTHFREGISFAQLIYPNINKIAVIYRDTPSSYNILNQFDQEKKSYSAEIVDIVKMDSITNTFKLIDYLQSKADALIVLNPTGILDERGRPMEGLDAATAIANRSKKPIVARNKWAIRAGMLCGVVKTGQEQGSLAARMVQDIFNGKSIKDIPVTQNRNGLRIINVTTARRLGITLPPEALLGTELVH